MINFAYEGDFSKVSKSKVSITVKPFNVLYVRFRKFLDAVMVDLIKWSTIQCWIGFEEPFMIDINKR